MYSLWNQIQFEKNKKKSICPQRRPGVTLGEKTDHILGQLSVRPCYSGSPSPLPPTSFHPPLIPPLIPPSLLPLSDQSGWPTHAILTLAGPKPRKG